MNVLVRRLANAAARLGRDRGGATAMTFSLLSAGLIGAAADYAGMTTTRSHLQSTADAAALAGAKEFRLGNADTTTVAQVARTFAVQTLATAGADGSALAATVTPSVDDVAKTVTVVITVRHPTFVMQAFGSTATEISVSATAKVVGGAPICVIGLDSKANSTILMDKTAQLEAPNCSVYSNSKSANGLLAKNYATMKAAFICSAGGKSSPGPGTFTPTPQTDCPVLPDPLAARPQPKPSGCIQTGMVISGGDTTLMPGTYCGGITITNGAVVTMTSGSYILKDGPLLVTGNGSLTGANVGLFLTGTDAVVNFDGPSTVSLTAPKSGEMAGMLIFEDRASPAGQVHQILSNNARMLLGTIYLPQGRLHVAANSPVADQSAYTIVVARLFTLSEGPTMVLNTNYNSTNIPVPAGVGPNGNRTALTN